MDPQKKAYLFALLAVLLWSTVASAFKLSLRHLPPAQLLLYAALVSTALLGLILAGQGKLAGAFRCNRRQGWQSAGLGLLNPCLYYLVLLKAYDLLPAQEAQVLNYTWAITMTLLAVPLLKQKVSLQQWSAIFLCYFGVVLIATRGELVSLEFGNPLGVALALVSTVFWALYWIFNTRDSRDPLVGLFLNFLFGLPMVLLFCILFTDFRLPPLPGILGAAYIGLFEMGLAYVLWLQALKLTTSTARISNLIFISPFLSLIFIHFLVGETILASTLFGLLFIIGGLVLQQWRRGASVEEGK